MGDVELGPLLFFIFLLLFWPITFTVLVIAMKINPFKKMTDGELKLIQVLQEQPQAKQDRREYDPDDYWATDEDGETYPDTGPTIRHPKNRDRAYSGSS